MPTMRDLGMLANQLYKDGQWDQDAATALGFTSSYFYLWSGEECEFDSYYAYSRLFDSTESIYTYYSRLNSDAQAVCIAD